MKQEEINDKGRRDFLKTAAVATLAATTCGGLACSCSSKKAATGEKVKLLSPDGEIVEIDSSYLNHQDHMAIVAKLEARQGRKKKKFVIPKEIFYKMCFFTKIIFL